MKSASEANPAQFYFASLNKTKRWGQFRQQLTSLRSVSRAVIEQIMIKEAE